MSTPSVWDRPATTQLAPLTSRKHLRKVDVPDVDIAQKSDPFRRSLLSTTRQNRSHRPPLD